MSVMTYDKLAAAMPIMLSDPVNRQHNLNDQCVGWWLSLPNWDGGRQWYDLFGLNHGTLNNMGTGNGWRPSTRPGGWTHLLCDGTATGGSVTLLPQTSVAINPASGQSVSMGIWYRTPSNTTGTTPALLGCVNDSTGGQGIGLFVSPTSGFNSIYTYVGVSSGATYTAQGTGGLGEDNAWHRALTVFDASLLKLTFYLDGKPVNSTSMASSGFAATEPLIAGGRLPTALILNGCFDDAKIWYPRALTAADVWNDYDNSRNGYMGTLNRLPLTMFHAGGLISPGSMPIFASPILNPAIIQGTTRYVA